MLQVLHDLIPLDPIPVEPTPKIWPIVCIVAGVAAAAAVLIIVLVRRKKKNKTEE